MAANAARAIDGALTDILSASPVNVEEIRHGLGMTLEEVAESVGRSARTISRWQSASGEASVARGGAARELRKLAQLRYLVVDVLGVQHGPDWLRSPNRGFRGKAPIDLVLAGQTDTVLAALEQLADGGPV